jgi:hypothetical protein
MDPPRGKPGLSNRSPGIALFFVQNAQDSPKTGGKAGGECPDLAAGEEDPKPECVEHESRGRELRVFSPVDGIPQDGAADMAKMDPELVRTPGFRFKRKKGIA